MTAARDEFFVDRAAEFQRCEIERNWRRLRHGRLIEEMKFCPMCVPQLFDASLEFVPQPVFCRKHAGFVLANIFGACVECDARGVARPAPMTWS